MIFPSFVQSKLSEAEQAALAEWHRSGNVRKRWFSFIGGVVSGLLLSGILHLIF